MSERVSYIPFNNSEKASIDYLIAILNDARYTTLQRVNDLSIEELHWQFKKGWNTIGVLLSHIISVENFFRIYFIEERELTESENEVYLPGIEMGRYIPQLITNKPIDYYIEEMDRSREKLISLVNDMDVENFYRKRKGYNEKTGFNLAWLLYHLAEDEVHHRGQISIIRKLYKNE